MAYKSDSYSKFDYGRFICGLFSYLLLQQQDAVGLTTFDSKIRSYLPPRSTNRHLKSMLDELTETEPGNDTGLGLWAEDVSKPVLGTRTLVGGRSRPPVLWPDFWRADVLVRREPFGWACSLTKSQSSASLDAGGNR